MTVNVSVDKLIPNKDNPNKMTGREFDLLVNNIQTIGFVEPILVRPVEGGKYRIVGGHHRVEAAKYLGYDELPCVVIDDPDFDDEAETFQIVRMNVIRGKLDPEAFYKMYNKMSEKYSDDILQDMFGFADEAEFARLVKQTMKGLPDELKGKFKEAVKEIKTVDGLAKLLNELFSKYGDTLPYGFMVFDYGGKKSVWLQSSRKTLDNLLMLGDICIENKVALDDVVSVLLEEMSDGGLEEVLEKAIKVCEKVNFPDGFVGYGTKQELEVLDEVEG